MPRTISTSMPHGAIVRARRSTRRSAGCCIGAVDDDASDGAQPGHRGVEGRGVDRLDADHRGIVGRARGDHQALRPVVVAPGDAVEGVVSNQSDHVGEHGVEEVRVGDLEHEVSEFDVVLHRCSLIV
jgi:hypothetical protein